MSGSGRKSQYRKSVTDSFLSDDYTPSETEAVVRVLGNRGDHTFEVQFEALDTALAKLPKKFNKLIWIKTGDFVVVDKDAAEADESSLISTREQYGITHILSKPNIKYLKSNRLWPQGFEVADAEPVLTTNKGSGERAVSNRGRDDLMPDYQEEEEEENEDEDAEGLLVDKMGNTVRRK